MQATQRYDVVIIGAGISGLICGAVLAGKGLKTLLVEKAATVGGRGRCIEHRGFRIQNAFRIQRIDHVRRAMNLVDFDLGFAQCPKPYLGFFDVDAKAYVELPHDLGAEFLPWLERMGVRDELLPEFVEAWQKLGSIPAEEVEEIWRRGTSFHDLADQLGFGEGLRSLLFDVTAWSAHGIGDARNYRAGHFLKVILPHYLTSGGIEIFQGLPTDQAIVDGFASAFQKRGGTLVVNTEALKIHTKDRRVAGVLARDGVFDDLKLIHADIVISSLPVWQNLRLLDGEILGEALRENLERLRATAGMAIGIWFGLEKRVSDLDLVIRLVAPNPSTGSRTRYVGGAWFPSNLAPGMAPEGKQLFVVETFEEAAKASDWEAIDEIVSRLDSYANDLFEALKRRGICASSLRDVVEWAKPVVYSPSWAGPQMRVEPLPEIRCRSVDGLYFTGETVAVTASTMGYDLAAAAALEVCDRITGGRRESGDTPPP